MKIKSLLLGSAAAMMAVSTAQAADIIIPEPEVVEYVRVCDAAGTGFFYIPGTETCLRIHGYVRYD
ncbi:porin, partial [Oceaniradius stylonematis]